MAWPAAEDATARNRSGPTTAACTHSGETGGRDRRTGAEGARSAAAGGHPPPPTRHASKLSGKRTEGRAGLSSSTAASPRAPDGPEAGGPDRPSLPARTPVMPQNTASLRALSLRWNTREREARARGCSGRIRPRRWSDPSRAPSARAAFRAVLPGLHGPRMCARLLQSWGGQYCGQFARP